jgi:hypothetical protein
MPATVIEISKFTLNRSSYTATLDTAIKRQIRQAARAFFKVASESVPVRTGFARGAFTNILEAIGGSGAGGSNPAATFINAVALISQSRFTTGRGRNRRYNAPTEYYTGSGGRVLKTPDSGKQFATDPTDIFEASEGYYSFNFNIAITYFDINDFHANPRTPSSPWQAFQRGTEAYKEYMETEGLRKLPKVQDFIVTETVSASF